MLTYISQQSAVQVFHSIQSKCSTLTSFHCFFLVQRKHHNESNKFQIQFKCTFWHCTSCLAQIYVALRTPKTFHFFIHSHFVGECNLVCVHVRPTYSISHLKIDKIKLLAPCWTKKKKTEKKSILKCKMCRIQYGTYFFYLLHIFCIISFFFFHFYFFFVSFKITTKIK